MTKLYNNMIEQISSKMRLTSKVNIEGSASIKRNVYYSDYDLFEKVQGMSEKSIHNHFKTVFEIIEKSDDVTITDFKCGEVGGNPLRWTYEEIKNNKNQGITFSEALKHKSIIKMDVVALINARFVEITEVYSIFLEGKSNMSPT